MVKGLQLFAERFAAYQDQYVLIGGAACFVAMENAGAAFRATKDLDIVLCLETMSSEFVQAFWKFVADGGYQIQHRDGDRKQYYRFSQPTSDDFPSMLELFSRIPDQLPLADGSHLTPIPTDAEFSSLSAILLDLEYYRMIQSGRIIVAGISIVRPEHLIPLKARAWLDLTNRKGAGEIVDSKSIRKHRNDVIRLFTIIDPTFAAEIAASIVQDLGRFLDQVGREDIDMKAMGITTMTKDQILAELRRIYKC